MPSEERNTLVGLITSLIVNGYFFWRIAGMFADGTSEAADGLQIWAQTVLWVVPVSIVATIALTILASILHGIFTGETKGIFVKDERDRQFELWGMGATMAMAVAGFLGSMVLLALGYSPFIAFNVIYLSFALGDLAGSVLKLAMYRCL